jgi:hypothetical protein
MNKWKSFKHRFKKLWYFLIRKEYKLGWVSYPPEIVILNDEFILKIEIDETGETE